MRLRSRLPCALVAFAAACRPAGPGAPPAAALDPIASRYVVLGLGLGRHYNLGRDLVADWVGRMGGSEEAGRWRAFGALLSAPHLPGDLRTAEQ